MKYAVIIIFSFFAYSFPVDIRAQETPLLQQCINPALFAAQHNSLTPLPTPKSVVVTADSAIIALAQKAKFAGNVAISSASGQIFADEATVTDDGNGVVAVGKVGFINEQMQVKSAQISLDAQTNSFAISQARYQLNHVNGNGVADQIIINGQDGLVLEDVSFSTCPLNQLDWQIKASEMNIGQAGNLGQAFNTRFYVAGVPILYLPYFAFPVTSQRQSGLLFPNISSSSRNGVDISQPYYWNIAPNYDATFAPRLLTNRGLQFNTELRYLSDQQQGQMTVEYLASDDEYENNDPRYFVRWEHTGQLNKQWQWFVDFNQISDDNYIVDLGSDFYNRADTYVNRALGLSYHNEQLSVAATFQDFDVIGEQANNYRALPHIDLSYSTDLSTHWQFDIESEFSYFDNQNPNVPTATRAHFAPTIGYQMTTPGTAIAADFTWYATYYQQRNIDNTDLARNINRNIGQVRLFAAAYFEREQSITESSGTITLEPKVQYLYTSYADQNNIGLYDSAQLLNNVNGLFRGQTFTGLDRISDNNQLTVGLTSRILDGNSLERGSVGIGQIFYFDDSQVINQNRSIQRSSIAAEFDFRLSSRWFTHSQLQLSTKVDKVERSSVALEYRRDAQSLVQLSHRYVRNLSQETINQLGLSAAWPINEQWRWVGRWYKDRTLSRTIEAYAGLQYESCCWAVKIIAQRHLANRYSMNGTQDINEFDSGVAVQFSFKGISSNRRSTSMLQDGMFGYRQPYLFN